MKLKILQFISSTILVISLCLAFGCKKAFLEAKPDKNLVIPSTISDFQAILDNTEMNTSPSEGEIASDNGWVNYETWNGLELFIKNSYIWEADVFNANSLGRNSWSMSYIAVFYSNIVLEGIKNISINAENKDDVNYLKGQALFFRAYSFYNLAQLFSKAYDSSTSQQDLGLPLRSSPDLNVKSVRATVQQTYDKIISDTKEAAQLLPDNMQYKTRPSKAAAYGLLARVYLSMRKYKLAGAYADSCLLLYNSLLDYNSIDLTVETPFPRFNTEVIFHSTGTGYFFFPGYGMVDSTLYRSYENNDLRLKAFFSINDNKKVYFSGSYDGTSACFTGIATDEMYIISAECNAREGDTQKAMNQLNIVLKNRWAAGTFVPLTANSASEALFIILKERRKELLARGLRWTDLRRLNKEPQFAITLKRNLNGKTYTLSPGDLRYVFQIPDAVIQLSGIQQNFR